MMVVYKTIEKVTLAEIRKEDGAQKYTFRSRRGDPYGGVIWLAGICRAKNAVVGMKGKLVWRSGKNYGLFFFEQYKEKNEKDREEKGNSEAAYNRKARATLS